MYTTKQVLEILGLKYWTFYAALRAGYIQPGIKLGPGYVWSNADLARIKAHFQTRKTTHEK